jgi:hypothetical protein
MLIAMIIAVYGHLSHLAPHVLALLGAGASAPESMLPTCPAMPSTTSEEDLDSMASRGIAKCYGHSLSMNDCAFFKTKDSDDVYESRGGDHFAHQYGEVDLSGMRQILHEALKIGLGTDKDVFQHAGEFKFYDLGSGFGKFPMYASFMGFRESTGIELDSQRAEQATERWNVMREWLPSCADTLNYIEDSFLTYDEWAKGKEKRVIFMDSYCWDSLWPQLTAMMESAEWGNDTVVASLGKTEMGRFNSRSQIYVKTSWRDETAVTFFTKCQSEDPTKCAGDRFSWNSGWRRMLFSALDTLAFLPLASLPFFVFIPFWAADLHSSALQFLSRSTTPKGKSEKTNCSLNCDRGMRLLSGFLRFAFFIFFGYVSSNIMMNIFSSD